MKITFSEKLSTKHNIIALFISNAKVFGSLGTQLNKSTDGALAKALEMNGFKAKKGEILPVIAPAGVEYEQIVIIGLGDEKEIDENISQSVGGVLMDTLKKTGTTSAAVIVEGVNDLAMVIPNIAYGAKLRSYSFDKYKTQLHDNDKLQLKELNMVTGKAKDYQKGYTKLQYISDGVFLGRNVVTEPPNHLYPASYASIIKEELAPLGVNVKVLGEKQLEKLGAWALLGVGQGSARESMLVTMEWQGNKKDKTTPVAFVGKGVTFDTGGISLKPSSGMEDMKYDMGGSAAVVGIMKALAGRKAKANVVGVVGLVENMPGDFAQRPSDVVTSMSGQTIEVLNTDAEGRLVLADALWYAQENFKSKYIIDLATLTGAIVIALGNEYAGLFSNSDELSQKISSAGDQTDEKVWRFPLGKNYDKLLDSPIADMQNISSERGAGSITAAQFLERFIKDDVNWAHIDIAGVAWTKKDKDICPKGATGFGIRLLDKMIQNNFEVS